MEKKIVHHFDRSPTVFITATATSKGEYILGPKQPCYTLSREDAVLQGVIRPVEFEEVGSAADDDTEAIRRTCGKIREKLAMHNEQDPTTQHQAMILVGTIAESQTVARIYNEVAGNVVCLSYAGKASREVVTSFKANKLQCLVIVGKLLEGFDQKSVSVVGILRNVAAASRVLFTQFVGRAVHKMTPADPVTAMVVSHVRHNQRENFEVFCQPTIATVDPMDDDDIDAQPDEMVVDSDE
mmetsp:Transcript_45773/g.115230  ORF Transcript_45773/g.115230 Transcript_45773/m.115230 type:complete len:240 (-) Transcript_45773:126-845(-)